MISERMLWSNSSALERACSFSAFWGERGSLHVCTCRPVLMRRVLGAEAAFRGGIDGVMVMIARQLNVEGGRCQGRGEGSKELKGRSEMIGRSEMT